MAKDLLEKGKDKIILPIDFRFTDEFKDKAPTHVGPISELKNNEMSLDVGPKTLSMFEEVLKDAKTIVWNGPMGLIEDKRFRSGTHSIFESMVVNEEALTVVGGGDTLSSIGREEHLQRIDHISSGGGAMLKYLENGIIVGVEAIKKS